MGDFRADIKIKVESLGKVYKQDMWINYFPESEADGVDQRIIDWFRETWEDIQHRHDNIIWKAEKKEAMERAKEEEKVVEVELKELKRLEQKYRPKLKEKGGNSSQG